MTRLEQWFETFSDSSDSIATIDQDDDEAPDKTRLVHKLREAIKILNKQKRHLEVSVEAGLQSAKEAYLQAQRGQALELMQRATGDKAYKEKIVSVLFQFVAMRIELEYESSSDIQTQEHCTAVLRQELQALKAYQNNGHCKAAPSDKILARKLARMVGRGAAMKAGPTVGTFFEKDVSSSRQ